MKVCTKCKKQKPLSEFNFKIKKLGLRQYQCKDCTRVFVRNHYEKNKEYYLTKARERNRKKRLEMRCFLRDYLLKHPCIDCGESDIVVLEFDHISREDKFKEVARLIRDSCTMPKIKEEVDKCNVRCANCHRRKTAREFRWFKNIDKMPQ